MNERETKSMEGYGEAVFATEYLCKEYRHTVALRDVSITFDPNAKEGQAAMADNRPLVKKLAIYAENVKEIDLHNVKIEGYEGERLHFANVGHFEED